MRRKDREVKDIKDVFDILNRCNTIRIAMNGSDYPYVVPVSFGTEIVNDKVVIYFHCARSGKKLDLLAQNSHVCIEGDIFIAAEQNGHDLTARYESVIGFGKCEFVQNNAEIKHGLQTVVNHYGFLNYNLDSCGALPFLLIGKITLDEITGKRNLPGTITPPEVIAELSK